MDLQLSDRAVLCTAASSGLGLASAEAIAGEDADVAVCGTTAEHVDDARETLRATGDGEVLAVQADLTDRDEVEALVEETVETFGGLDHVVASAGGPPSGGFDDVEDSDWYGAFDLLVMSLVWTVREAGPHLRESGESGEHAASITAITSRTVREVADDLVLSNAVRRTVIGLVKTLSREWAPEVRANAVLPGSLETARIQELIEDAVERGDAPDYEAGYQQFASGIPLERMGEPEELGDVVAMLASPRASYVNGTTLAIDGGSLRS